MNLGGYRLPGMCTPHNTNQYFMGRREYLRIDENEEAMEVSGEGSDCSTEDEDFPLMAAFPSTDQ